MKIEVFIPAYNCHETLYKTLASLVAQTDSDFSVCVVDDCNEKPLDDVCKMFPMLNLRIVRNEKNLGCGLSRQSAIDTSDADYLIPLDSDDMLLPIAISIFKQNALLKPDVDFFIG
jgi:glycosyltransferase involved in cell wall biosynthesis